MVLNACFPRSGHRFHRNMLQSYFGESFKFHESHSKVGVPIYDANYIKNHDFGLVNFKTKELSLDSSKKYVVQYRHPLASLVSYFEFQVKHGNLEDTQKDWDVFFSKNILYWKAFVKKWIIDISIKEHIFFISYENLVSSTEEVMLCLIKFLSDTDEVDEPRLRKSVQQFKGNIIRYREDEKIGRQVKARNINNFKYFSYSEFFRIEEDLWEEYLRPLSIERQFFDE